MKNVQFVQFSECYLMTTDQCDEMSSHDCLPNHGCQSGVVNEPQNCPDEPSQFSCPLGADGQGLDHDGEKIQWFCTGESPIDVVDIYKLSEAPGGTVCSTDHK